MKAAKIGLFVLVVLFLVIIPCYGQTAKEYYYTGQDSRPEDELIKLVIQAFRYERKWTGVNSYYVWATAPGEERSEDMQFIVVREKGEWKILGFKVWEEEEFFKALIQ